MHVFARERSIRFISPMLAVVSPEKSDSIVRQFRGLVFPEERYDQLRYVKKAKEVFNKMRKYNISVRPL